MALLANGLIKVPMQFVILFIGAMVFVFYQFVAPPVFFNPVETARMSSSIYAPEYQTLEQKYKKIHEEKQHQIRSMLAGIDSKDDDKLNHALQDIKRSRASESEIKGEVVQLIRKVNPKADTNDTNYIFLNFVIHFLPVGLIGLVLAAIFSASMSSTSAELNALASTTVVDIYKRMIRRDATDRHYLIVSKIATVFWGFYAIAFAMYANRLGSLIEAVNILGSLFYGTILGIFLVAFYFKNIGGNATFFAAVIAELVVIACFAFTEIPYLWYNVIGCVCLVVLAHVLNPLLDTKRTVPTMKKILS
jgi:solute:Na+ symporter, SSS family